MATWLKPLLLALLAALILHLVGMIGIGSQMQTSAALAQKNDPLFTRTIEAASPQADAPPPDLPKPEPAPPRASTAVAVVVSKPQITDTLAEPEPKRESEPIASAPITSPEPASSTSTDGTSTVATSTPTDTLTLAAATPSQTLSAQPTGLTDSLLITGAWPADTRVSYKLTGFFQGELFGTGQVQWTREGEYKERYQVRVTANVPGLYELRVTSQGRLSPSGLLPESFEEYSKRLLASPRVRRLQLDADDLILEGNRRISRPTIEPLSVQDSVSQFIDLGHRFSQGRAVLEPGQTVRVWVGRPGALDDLVYDIGAAETIDLPRIGPITVHEFKPRPIERPRGTITMSFWLAPQLQFLPAKVRIQVNNEAYIELIADQIQQR